MGPDGGVDLVLRKNGEKLLVQCKHWRIERVGVKVVRELFGVVAAENASGGIAVSSGTFTQEAMDFARGKPLELINGAELTKMIAEVKNAPMPQARMAHSISDVSFTESFSNEPAGVVQCPVCGRDMVLRTANKGARSGEQFWGCPAFPKCRGIKPCGPNRNNDTTGGHCKQPPKSACLQPLWGPSVPRLHSPLRGIR